MNTFERAGALRHLLPLLLLCPVIALAEMPSVEAIAHFTGNTPEGGNGATPGEQPLMEGSDGSVYGWSRTGGGTSSIHNTGGDGGALFKFALGATAGSGITRVGNSGPTSLTRALRGSDGYYYATYTSSGSARSLTRYLPGNAAWEDVRHFETTWPTPDPIRRPTHVFEGSDGRLYGTSPASGTSTDTQHGNGVWVINKDGTGLALLHAFAAANPADGSDGTRPDFVMQGSDGLLYGLTRQGGTPTSGLTGRGVLFRLNTDGSGFTKLHEFDGGDGNLTAVPRIPLLEVGGRLYGITSTGGANNTGVLYRIERDGSGFQVLHHFAAAAGNASGRAPKSILLAQDGHLYGIALGGVNNQGVIFRYHLTAGYQALYAFDEIIGPVVRGSNTGTNAVGAIPQSLMQASNGEFYGLAERGGSIGWGTVFRFKVGDEVPVFRFWPKTNFYMGAPANQPEHYPPGRWADGSLIVQNYNQLDMRWKLENVDNCVASSDQPGSTWSGPLSALARTPLSNGAGYSYHLHAVVPTVGR